MKNDINTHLIKNLLNTSAIQLKPATVEKLRNVRSYALDHQRTHGTAPVLAWLSNQGGRNEGFNLSKSINWIVALLFVACLLSAASLWHNYTTEEHEISEVDIAILTGELPIHVYLD
jgi:Protein of unknown function (DUF3619)